jgi:hypothetical protein
MGSDRIGQISLMSFKDWVKRPIKPRKSKNDSRQSNQRSSTIGITDNQAETNGPNKEIYIGGFQNIPD